MSEIREALTTAVFDAIDEVNALRPATDQLPKTLETELVGEAGRLDSLGVVNLIVALEPRVEAVLRSPVSLLADERFDPGAGAFRTVASLVEHLLRLGAGDRDVA
ncbi:MAG: hypothetical protein IT184_09515 [Acidobacteria bacterium]|nr:hypothetical protein [Acidobacteriota bacterium]